jgi:hypothetical protein
MHIKGEIIIVDVKHMSSIDTFAGEIKQHKNKQIIALTPCSFYMLDNLNLEYKTLHSYVSTEVFRDRVLSNINLIEKSLTREYKGLLVDLIKYVSYIEYERTIKYILGLLSISNIVYITDIKNIEYDLTNNTSILSTLNNINIKWILVPKIVDQRSIKFSNKFKNISLKRIVARLVGKLLNIQIYYDWENFVWLIFKHSVFSSSSKQETKIKIKGACSKGVLDQLTSGSFYKILVENIFKERMAQERSAAFKTWLLSTDDYLGALKSKAFFYQHGNYLYKHIMLKYAEIMPSDVNFVFNDYTKKVFEDMGANKAHSVGSLNFQKTIKSNKIKYDYLYITQGHDYLGNLQYVDFENSLHNFDGYELYQRHKSIIELFGKKLKDKTVVIRVHPLVITSGVYVPFWELASSYSNITIDVSMPMHTLIEESKHIISDYFSSDFINREVHYERSVILFNGAPTPLPEDIIKDMSKMFILVNSVDEMSNKIKNIDYISKKRQRYDEIIEYYSSKKCDTKHVIAKILDKEI